MTTDKRRERLETIMATLEAEDCILVFGGGNVRLDELPARTAAEDRSSQRFVETRAEECTEAAQ